MGELGGLRIGDEGATGRAMNDETGERARRRCGEAKSGIEALERDTRGATHIQRLENEHRQGWMNGLTCSDRRGFGRAGLVHVTPEILHSVEESGG